MNLNLPLIAMWSTICILGLYSRHMTPQYLVYFMIVAFIVTVVK